MLRRSCCIADDIACQNCIENSARFECFNRKIAPQKHPPARELQAKKNRDCSRFLSGCEAALKRLRNYP
jgi:hypothetical protein